MVRASLSHGRRASIVEESRRIPMNSREVEGGKVLPGAMGMSNSVNRWRTLQRAVAQWVRGGAAAMKKSSRMWITFGMWSLF